MKRSLKHLLGQLIFTTRFDQFLLRQSAVVVAFHRVQEACDPDGLTIGTEMFERQCRFFMRHFDVIPLRDLVARLEQGRPLDRQLAITFDDGYRDNFENAAPVLEKLGLPATFFVISQWMGSDVVPWWDAARGVRHPWMSWDQVRALRRRGFDVGAHTRTHADLGAVGPRQAAEEILGARIEVERQLHEPIDLFAYPYGLQRNLAEPHRHLVKNAGFRCCCSCFGGVVTSTTDPFHIRRVPISPWYASPHQLGFELTLGVAGIA